MAAAWSIKHRSRMTPGSCDRAAAVEQALAACAQGWTVLRHDICPIRAPRAAGIAFPCVVLHPQIGVALLDIAPEVAVDAVGRLRRTLDTHEFHANFPGYLPVVHRVLPRDDLARLPDILDYAFAWEGALTLLGGETWVDAVAQLLTGEPLRRVMEIPAKPAKAESPRENHQESRQQNQRGSPRRMGAGIARRPGAAAVAVAGCMLVAGAAFSGTGLLVLPSPVAQVPVQASPPALEHLAAVPNADPVVEVAGLEAPALDAMVTAREEATPLLVQSAASPEVALTLHEAEEPPVPAAIATKPVLTEGPGIPAGVPALLSRGDALLKLGDVSAARRFYERAVTAGSGAAAVAMGKTYDKRVLAGLGAFGLAGDAGTAASWYRIAVERGDAEAMQLLVGLTEP